MTAIGALFRHEWRSAWATPLAGTFIIIYALAAMLFTFFVGEFFARGRADLHAFFQFQPWLLLILAPALAMREWSEEFQHGTAETLLTLPVSTLDIVLAKFLAQFCIAAMAIATTATLWITATYLGAPDHGAIITSYMASLLIAAVLLALSNTMSALCTSSVSSFGLSLIIGALLLALGAPLLQGFFSHLLPPALQQVLQDFGVSGASRLMVQGLIRASDMLNLLLATGAGLVITRNMVDRRRHVVRAPGAPAILLALLGLTLLSSWALRGLRVDMTDGNSFTLSAESRALVQRLREPVRLTLMTSGTGATHYPQLQNHAQRLDDLLQRYSHAGHGKIIVEKLAVEPVSDSEERARKAGMQAIETPEGDTLYYGLLVRNSTNGLFRLPFLGDVDERQLEYAISRAIVNVSQPQASRLGILSSLPLATGRGGAFAALRADSAPMQVFQQLQADFQIQLLLPDTDNLQGLSALLLLQPPPMSPRAMSAIDAFAKSGKPVLVVADPWPERWQDQPDALASATALAPLLRAWGVALLPDHVVVDTKQAQIAHSETPSGQKQMQAYPLWLSINDIALLSSGAWQVTGTPAKILLSSSNSATYISIAEAMTRPAPEALAALPPGTAAQPLAVRQNNLLFIADADMLDDDIWSNHVANRTFLLGELDVLLGRPNLSALRARPSSIRPFTRLQALQAEAQAAWGAKSTALLADMEATRAKLATLEQATDSSQTRTAEVIAFRTRLAETGKALRRADRDVAQRLRQVERQLTAANIILMPLAIALLTALLLLRRRARMRAHHV